MSGKLEAPAGKGHPVEGPVKDPLAAILGPSPMVTVTIAGVKLEALVDTGSQVTMISEGLYNHKFRGKAPLSPVSFIRITAANGLAVPYVGYFEADIQMGGKVIQKRGILVKKGEPEGENFEVILGTNVLKELGDWPEVQGFARVAGKTPVHIPARSIKLVRATGLGNRARGRSPSEVLIEPLPQGCVHGILVPSLLSRVQGSSVWVQAVNVTDDPVVLHPRTRLGTLKGFEGVEPLSQSDVKVEVTSNRIKVVTGAVAQSPEESKIHFDLSQSKCTGPERRTLGAFLRSNSGLFFTDETDLGYAEKGKHRIRLTDDEPVASNFRRIPPSQL